MTNLIVSRKNAKSPKTFRKGIDRVREIWYNNRVAEIGR